ncbi:MAG: hypothetical protein ABSF53_15130 [Terracidiphilus sp.]
MGNLPGWIQKENEQIATARSLENATAQRKLHDAEFLQQHGTGFFNQLGLAMQSHAQALDKLEGAELFGSFSKSITGAEHNIYARVDRRSLRHGPDSAWVNLWYIPGKGYIRCWYRDTERANITLHVYGLPEIGQDIRAHVEGKPVSADELAEIIVRQMVAQVRAS